MSQGHQKEYVDKPCWLIGPKLDQAPICPTPSLRRTPLLLDKLEPVAMQPPLLHSISTTEVSQTVCARSAASPSCMHVVRALSSRKARFGFANTIYNSSSVPELKRRAEEETRAAGGGAI